MKRRFILMCITLIFMLMAVNVSAATTITKNTTGIIDGYDYELWKDSGNTIMTINGGGAFSCSWNDINNAMFKMGRKYSNNQPYSMLGEIIIDYACDFLPNGNSYLGVYGWNTNPLIEYYIIEAWGAWKPPGINNPKGTVTIDGSVYDIYHTTRYNMLSIVGPSNFEQYWSVRREKRTSGLIHVSEHFKAWENLGMKTGNLYDVSLLVEGYQSSGRADVTKMKFNDPVIDKEPPTVPADLKSLSVSSSTVDLAWTESTDNMAVSGYNIYKGSELVGITEATNYTVADLAENTSYKFTVKAKDTFGNISSASNELSVTTKVNVKSGDINKDGAVNSIDLATLKSYFWGIPTTIANPVAETADINGDGSIDALDYAVLKKYLLGVIDSLPSK